MTDDHVAHVAGMQELFAKKPELFDAVTEMIEAVHDFLYDANGGDTDTDIISWNRCIPEILEAAKEVPSLRAWVEQLDNIRERERAKCKDSAA